MLNKTWRFIKRMGVVVACALVALLLLLYFLKPAVAERREIFSGVYLTVDDIPNQLGKTSRVMKVEVHWDKPGVTISNREFSFPIDPGVQQQFHYRLSFADFALIREGASVLINTALYYPDSGWRILPGLPVAANETIVQDGVVSHVHPHSYLLYWDREMNAHMLTRKPPDKESLEEAITGIGIQGVPINNGRAAYNAIGNKEEYFDRTFIAVDPQRKILYLFAFTEIDAFTAIDYAVDSGAQFGGQMDSGRSCNLLIGYGADGVLPHTGIRNSRPLGPYMIISANRL